MTRSRSGRALVHRVPSGRLPVIVLNQIKLVPEVCRIYCATANPVQVILAEATAGRGILGVVDGESPLGVQTESDVAARKRLLREMGTSSRGYAPPTGVAANRS